MKSLKDGGHGRVLHFITLQCPPALNRHSSESGGVIRDWLRNMPMLTQTPIPKAGPSWLNWPAALSVSGWPPFWNMPAAWHPFGKGDRPPQGSLQPR